MLEALVIILGVVLGVGGIWVGIHAVVQKGVTSVKFNVDPSLPAPEPSRRISSGVYQPAITARASIPKDIADELDRTPEWWDAQFHKELERAGAKSVGVVPAEYNIERSYNGEVVYAPASPGYTVLEGCTCSRCS